MLRPNIFVATLGILAVATGSALAQGTLYELVPDASASSSFGWQISVSGDQAIVADPGADAAYVFERTGGAGNPWAQVAKLTSSDASTSFAFAVAIDGDWALVTDRDRGYLYAYEKPVGGWADATEDQNTYNGEAWGYRIALDGTQMAWTRRGAGGEVWTHDGANWIYGDGGVNPGGALSAPGKANSFGENVDIDGDLVVIGDFLRGGNGGAYIYQKSPDWGTTSTPDRIIDGAGAEWLGIDVAADNGSLLLGAYHNNTDQGAAYIYDDWSTSATADTTLLGDGSAEYFGVAVDLDGSLAVVGTRADKFYVFEKTGGAWSQWDVVSDPMGSSHSFSEPLALSGAFAAIGSPGNGKAYLYEVPEPSSFALFLVGMGLMILWRYR